MQAFLKLSGVQRRPSKIFALLLCCAASACGGSKKAPPEQIIAKGDNFEITLTELDSVLRRAPPVLKDEVSAARRKLLDDLIKQKLLSQAALDAGLDRQADTMQAIEMAKRSILAQAYARKLAGDNTASVSPAEIERYYDQHPERFAQRRKLILREIVLPLSFERIADRIEQFDKEGLESVQATLAEEDKSVDAQVVDLETDGLPAEVQKNLGRLTQGASIMYQTPGQVHLGQLQSMEIDPVPLNEARDLISRQIAQERTASIVSSAVKAMWQSRKIEIVNPDLKKGFPAK